MEIISDNGAYDPEFTAMTTKSPFPGMDPYLEPHWRDFKSFLTFVVQ